MSAERRSQHVRRVVRDFALGLAIFAIAGFAYGGVLDDWTTSMPPAAASGLLVAEEMIVSSPADAAAEEAIIAATRQTPCLIPDAILNNVTEIAGLALSFALLFAFNVSFWGHVRRVYASPRQQWRARRGPGA